MDRAANVKPEPNPIGNLSTVLKSQVCANKPRNLIKFYEFCRKDWSDIQPEFFQKVADG